MELDLPSTALYKAALTLFATASAVVVVVNVGVVVT